MPNPIPSLNAAPETAEDASRRAHARLIKAEEVAHMGFLDWDLKIDNCVAEIESD